ncbi:6611_t:CDS:2 [Entrophospora sp. SA101]|nr:1802_t:CDS:2 [Entrophospora sp. SA101]CAJ0856889.1 6611_t:CDS:2 [Entrophospora sp. SA101]
MANSTKCFKIIILLIMITTIFIEPIYTSSIINDLNKRQYPSSQESKVPETSQVQTETIKPPDTSVSSQVPDASPTPVTPVTPVTSQTTDNPITTTTPIDTSTPVPNTTNPLTSVSTTPVDSTIPSSPKTTVSNSNTATISNTTITGNTTTLSTTTVTQEPITTPTQTVITQNGKSETITKFTTTLTTMTETIPGYTTITSTTGTNGELTTFATYIPPSTVVVVKKTIAPANQESKNNNSNSLKPTLEYNIIKIESFSSQFYPMVYPIYQPPVNPSYPQNNHPINFSLLSPTKPINSQPRDIPSINDLLEKLDQKYRDDLFTQFLDSFINESIDVLDILT